MYGAPEDTFRGAEDHPRALAREAVPPLAIGVDAVFFRPEFGFEARPSQKHVGRGKKLKTTPKRSHA